MKYFSLKIGDVIFTGRPIRTVAIKAQCLLVGFIEG